MTGLATTVSTTSVDIGAAAGIVVALLLIAAATIRLSAAFRSRQGHESCAELLRAAHEQYQGIYMTLRAENARLAGHNHGAAPFESASSNQAADLREPS